jgi:hypothetical protein
LPVARCGYRPQRRRRIGIHLFADRVQLQSIGRFKGFAYTDETSSSDPAGPTAAAVKSFQQIPCAIVFHGGFRPSADLVSSP